MSVPESSLDTIRLFLRQDSDGLDRALGRMQQDGTIDSYPRVLAATMVVLLHRRLGPTPTLPDIVSLVARLRSDHRISDELDVHPLTTEKMIRAGYGDAEAITGLDQHELAEIQIFLVDSLAEDENLDDAGVETLISDVRDRA